MALFVYNLLLLLLSPLLLLFLLYRLAKGKEDRSHWGERWGRYQGVAEDTRTPRFWVHAVSVGELMAAIPVLRELRGRYPGALILVSTTTTTGREVAIKQIPPADAVVYYPLDLPFAVQTALNTVRPDALILMEWEIWPNFLCAARKKGVKIAVLNGRISDRGLRRGLKGGFFTAPGLQAVDLFAMQSEEDSRRAALVGAAPEKIRTLGNTKFDESLTPLTDAERDTLRAELGIPPRAPVWVCGSTREDEDPAVPMEETLVGRAAARVRERFPVLFLIVAPRHPHRFDQAAQLLTAEGETVSRRSQPGDGDPGTTLLLDTFGELARIYAVADVAFIGGSLVRRGGQSVFQPLAQGVPVVFGPFMNNQRDIAALAKSEGVGFEVADGEALASEVLRLLSLPPAEKRELGVKARELIERNQGVAVRCVDAVTELLEPQEPQEPQELRERL